MLVFGRGYDDEDDEDEYDGGIHSKSGCPGCTDSAENSNFPQKDCLRTQKLSVAIPES